MKKVVLLLISVIMVFCLVACDNKVNVNDENLNSGNNIVNNVGTSNDTNNRYVNVEKNPIVTMEMENGNIIKMELYPKITLPRESPTRIISTPASFTLRDIATS